MATSYTNIPKQVPGLFVNITASSKKKFKVEFASDQIAKLVIRHHVKANRAELILLLNSLDGPSQMMGALQGYLLEESMHAALLSPQPAKYQLLDLHTPMTDAM